MQCLRPARAPCPPQIRLQVITILRSAAQSIETNRAQKREMADELRLLLNKKMAEKADFREEWAGKGRRNAQAQSARSASAKRAVDRTREQLRKSGAATRRGQLEREEMVMRRVEGREKQLQATTKERMKAERAMIQPGRDYVQANTAKTGQEGRSQEEERRQARVAAREAFQQQQDARRDAIANQKADMRKIQEALLAKKRATAAEMKAISQQRLMARISQVERDREAAKMTHDTMYMSKIAPVELAGRVRERPISAPPKTPLNEIRGDWALWK